MNALIQLKTKRDALAVVLRRSGDLISLEEAADALGVSRQAAAKTLWRWSSQGWLKHLRRGLYAPVPLTALAREQVLADPRILVSKLFHPGYVAGWSAAEHWGLTEQIFRDILVCTARSVRPREQTIQGIPFVLRRVRPETIFGMRSVWHGKTKVQISDPHRTVVDILNDPGLGGGIRHANDCLEAYLASDQADVATVIAYADRLGNGAVFKRLGFLLARTGADKELLEHCRSRLTAGNAKLDPALPCRRLIKKWRLWIPKTWEKASARD